MKTYASSSLIITDGLQDALVLCFVLYSIRLLDDVDDECAADSSYQLTISRGDGVKYWTGSLLLLSFLCNQIIRRGVSFEALCAAQREESTAIN